eukprot:CAMPEP_0195061102 /NCGR_PEP_ID=MMETSP0448-20130528/8181_1 /TAXON_ID=66468 /ORGANISM="Heterocapsa triquestra, Strain CCMP 448" /LENGTH=174 /DNA_ID=CAMNT_0040091637 /DNA_START=59 /DNA_END=583 /DNA_ORIENTATION=-
MAQWTPLAAVLILGAVHASSGQTLRRGDQCAGGGIEFCKHIAPDCFASCPQLCSPLKRAIDTYVRGDDVYSVACPEMETFKCTVLPENAEACGPLLDQGADWNFIVPRSRGQLVQICNERSFPRGAQHDLPADAGDGNATTTTAESVPSAATRPEMIGRGLALSAVLLMATIAM